VTARAAASTRPAAAAPLRLCWNRFASRARSSDEGVGFGMALLIAMTPLITIQIVGLDYKRRLRKAEAAAISAIDDEVIDYTDAANAQASQEDL